MKNPSFFPKGDKWVGTGTYKKCSKLVRNDLKTEKGHLVNWWRKLSLGQESQRPTLGVSRSWGGRGSVLGTKDWQVGSGRAWEATRCGSSGANQNSCGLQWDGLARSQWPEKRLSAPVGETSRDPLRKWSWRAWLSQYSYFLWISRLLRLLPNVTNKKTNVKGCLCSFMVGVGGIERRGCFEETVCI